MIILSNDKLTVKINEMGAELKSIQYNDTEYIWEVRSAILRNRKTGKALRGDFDYAPYFLLWHKPNSPYICLEPWAGVQDIVGSDYDITKKEGIISLEKDKTYVAEHTITIIA